jgi:hypothetical protein
MIFVFLTVWYGTQGFVGRRYSDIKLELILLLYFAGRYDEASDGFGEYKEMEGARIKDRSVEAFRQRLSLLLRVDYRPKRHR